MNFKNIIYWETFGIISGLNSVGVGKTFQKIIVEVSVKANFLGSGTELM